MSEGLTRRELVLTGTLAAAGIAVGASSGCAGPGSEAKADVDTPSFEFKGETTMSGKLLVGYATRTGSTVGVAEEIARALSGRGYEVDVRPLRENPSLEGYDGAVLGSAVNGGQWLPEAVSFVQANKVALSRMPFAAYCVHIMNAGDDAKAAGKRKGYLDSVRAVTAPGAEGFFPGKGPSAEDSSLIMRWAFKAFGGAGEGDCRDFEAIRSWAEDVNLA